MIGSWVNEVTCLGWYVFLLLVLRLSWAYCSAHGSAYGLLSTIWVVWSFSVCFLSLVEESRQRVLLRCRMAATGHQCRAGVRVGLFISPQSGEPALQRGKKEENDGACRWVVAPVIGAKVRRDKDVRGLDVVSRWLQQASVATSLVVVAAAAASSSSRNGKAEYFNKLGGGGCSQCQ